MKSHKSSKDSRSSKKPSEDDYYRRHKLSPKDSHKKKIRSRSHEKDSSSTGISSEEIRKIAMNVYEDISKESKEHVSTSIAQPAKIYSNPIVMPCYRHGMRPQSHAQPIMNQPNPSKYRVKYSDEMFNSNSDYLNNMFNGIFPISKGEVHKISECDTDSFKYNDHSPNEMNPYYYDYSYLNEYKPISSNPVDRISPFASKLMKKMGWNEGEALGKTGNGLTNALQFDIKRDRKGLASIQEKYEAIVAQKSANNKVAVNKNPVSALMEFCQKRRMTLPTYTEVESSGPSNMPQFRISVTLMEKTFVTTEAYTSKKEAKNKSAALAVKSLNV